MGFRSIATLTLLLAFAAGAAAAPPAADYVIRPAKVVWYSAGSLPPPARVQPASLYVNNPLTVYGGIELPTGRGSGSTDTFVLDGDSAIALYGSTPPPITYYSFTMNEFGRYPPEGGAFFETNSSIGLSINDANIGTAQGRAFDDRFVLIVAAQFRAADVARGYFLRQGVPAHSINTIVVPHRFTRQSNERPPLLNFLTRLTYRTEAEKAVVDAYIQRTEPPLRALLFKGPGAAGDVQDTDLVRWEDSLRSDSSELGAATTAELDLLTSRVRQHLAAQGFRVRLQGVEGLRHIDPERMCREAGRTCNYDTPDALYGAFFCPPATPGAAETPRCIDTLPDAATRIVIAGVNHHRFGQGQLMSYYSYAVTRLSDLQGVATLPDVSIVGSAARYLPELPNADDYFVLTIARDCGGEPYCLAVPYDDAPDTPGLPKNALVQITTRIYLDRIMGTAPNPANFLPARLLWLRR